MHDKEAYKNICTHFFTKHVFTLAQHTLLLRYHNISGYSEAVKRKKGINMDKIILLWLFLSALNGNIFGRFSSHILRAEIKSPVCILLIRTVGFDFPFGHLSVYGSLEAEI